ncbi:MAG: hypothetical protein MK207_09475 [Saprospiraceae bacterium]|nr:hypothetical protein [Saprospiraceae bacterium]
MFQVNKSLINIFTFSLTLLLFSNLSFAQKNKKTKAIDEAHIEYTMTAEGGMAAAMSGTTMELFFTPSHAKVLANMMNGLMKMDVRVDNSNRKGIMLLDLMGQKKVIEMGEVDLQKSKAKNQKPTEVVYTKKYKKIAGYKCQEARVTLDGMDEPAIVYLTDKITPSNVGDVSMMQFTGLKGFPLSWKIEQQGMVINMEAVAVYLDKLDESVFDMNIPEGYEKMKIEDLQGMGGSFGM